MNTDVGMKHQSATHTPSIQSTLYHVKSLAVKILIEESFLDDSQCVASVMNKEYQKNPRIWGIILLLLPLTFEKYWCGLKAFSAGVNWFCLDKLFLFQNQRKDNKLVKLSQKSSVYC